MIKNGAGIFIYFLLPFFLVKKYRNDFRRNNGYILCVFVHEQAKVSSQFFLSNFQNTKNLIFCTRSFTTV